MVSTAALLILGVLLAGWSTTAVLATRLRRKLRTDHLTGLRNRAALRNAFTHTSLRSGRGMAVLMLDLDGFKAINDTWGHHIGDAVLVKVAERLRRHEQRGRFAVRLSGDEFAFWMGKVETTPTGWQSVDRLARDLAADIAEPMVIEGIRLHITVSVGTATTTVKPASLGSFLELADHAMYRDKARSPVSRRLSGAGAGA